MEREFLLRGSSNGEACRARDRNRYVGDRTDLNRTRAAVNAHAQRQAEETPFPTPDFFFWTRSTDWQGRHVCDAKVSAGFTHRLGNFAHVSHGIGWHGAARGAVHSLTAVGEGPLARLSLTAMGKLQDLMWRFILMREFKNAWT